MRLLVVFFLLFVRSYGLDLYFDHYHALNQNIVLTVEQNIDIQESLGLGINIFDSSVNNVYLHGNLWRLMYRRYVQETTKEGVFYSFGVETGQMKLLESSNVEKELVVMPFYNIGLKSKFNERWSHIIKIDVGYLMVYTKNINIDSVIGIQVTPFFSFGYKLD